MNDDGFIAFSEKDWEKATPDQQKWLTFNTLRSMNQRLKKLERQPLLNFTYTFAGSAVGGAIMILILVALKVKVI